MRISDWSSDVCSSDLVIGASAGGVSALRHLLGALEPDFNWPIVIVLHIGSSNVDHLVEVLAATSALPVIEARPGAAPRPGTVHVAPGGYDLLIEDDRRFSLAVDARETGSASGREIVFQNV